MAVVAVVASESQAAPATPKAPTRSTDQEIARMRGGYHSSAHGAWPEAGARSHGTKVQTGPPMNPWGDGRWGSLRSDTLCAIFTFDNNWEVVSL